MVNNNDNNGDCYYCMFGHDCLFECPLKLGYYFAKCERSQKGDFRDEQ